MSSDKSKNGTVAALLLIMMTIFLFTWLTLEVDFPANEYVSDKLRRQLVKTEPYDRIATHVSRFLWENRALDLTGQAFVIVAAVICCLALLKQREGS